MPVRFQRREPVQFPKGLRAGDVRERSDLVVKQIRAYQPW
jgi:hypothetical protein